MEQRTPATSLTMFADPLSLVEGAQGGTLLVASLTDSDHNTNPFEYNVSVNWGDGSAATPASLMGMGSSFQIMSGHTYARAGSYAVTVTVNDADGSQASLQETAVVRDAPLSGILGNPPQSVAGGQLFSATLGSYTDADPFAVAGDFTASINWGDGSPNSAGTITGGGGGGMGGMGGMGGASFTVGGSHTYAAGGSYNYTLTIQDSGGNTLTEHGTFTASNPPPTAANDSYSQPANGTLTVSAASGVLANDTSPGGLALTAVLATSPQHGTLSLHSDGSFAYTPTAGYVGTDAFGYYAVAAGQRSNTAGVALNVTPPPPSWTAGGPTFVFAGPSTPVISAIQAQSGAEGAAVSLPVSATDASGYPLSYDAVGLPAGLSISHSTGLISGTIDYSAAEAFGGQYTPTVVVANPLGQSSAQSFSWAASDTVRPPTFTAATANQTNNIGDSPTLTVSATQPDGDQLIYDDGGTLPSGLTIDSLSGVISGAVANDAASSYNVTLTATDNTQINNPQTVSQSLTWTINTQHNPAVTSPGWQNNAAGDVVSVQVPATDAPGNTLTYSATGLPDGLGIDPGSGVISGTLQNDAAQVTPYQVTALVTDGTASASQTFPWMVNTVGVTSPGDQYNVAGDVVSLQTAGVDAADIALTYSATGLPQGLSIDSGTGVISGTIAATAPTNQPDAVTISATDGLNSGATSFAWNVAPLTLPDRTDVEGATVSFQTPEPYPNNSPSYAATGLPNGVSINAGTGLISGGIADGDAAAGPYDVTVTTAYGDGTTGTQAFVWTVHPAQNGVLTLAAPANQTTIAGTQVSLILSAGDNDEDLLTYSATGLPDGLSIDPYLGVISGAPAEDAIQSTPYNVTVTVDDGAGATASQTFQWTVTDSAFTLNGMPISQTEGAGVQTFDVATFYDPDTNRAPTDYAATINWGDGQSSPGTVDGTAGEDTVSGDHVYLRPGNYTVLVSVTDPAGTTVSSTAAAAVAAAPLTATGNFVDGALSGSTAALTVATFTDGNTYDAAGDYTATINWGDGTATTGVVSGADGEFTVSGPHNYQHDGTYPVVATITDADGTSAQATSTVTAGDLYAGVTQTLTVASFTGGYSGATASGYTATINWGAGSSTGGMVTQAGGNFNVAGIHAYGVSGVYTVQATVSDQMGHTITASNVIHIAPAPVSEFGGAVDPSDIGDMGAPLAIFTLPQGYGASGAPTATTAWGDGTTTTESLVNIGGDIWEAMGGHAYASMGQYAVSTLLTNAAGLLAAAVTMAEPGPATPYKIEGPVVVPGNSIYRYVVNIPDTPANQFKAYPAGGRFTVTATNGATATKEFDGHAFDPANGNFSQLFVDVQFGNTPGDVTIKLPKANWLEGVPEENLNFTVHVVEVLVSNVPKAFVASQALTDGPVTNGLQIKATVIVGPTPEQPTNHQVTNQVVHLVLLRTRPGDNPVPALEWQAKITLDGGPDGNKYLKDILIGFHQTGTITMDHALSKSDMLKSNAEGVTALDVASDSIPPWCDGAFVGGVGSVTLTSNDSPRLAQIFNYAAANFLADEIVESLNFKLSVAAATRESFSDPLWGDTKTHLFQEARASWSVNADGTITNITGTGQALKATWTPNLEAGVKAPAGNVWIINASPPPYAASGGLLATGPLANAVVKSKIWEYTDRLNP